MTKGKGASKSWRNFGRFLQALRGAHEARELLERLLDGVVRSLGMSRFALHRRLARVGRERSKS